MAYGTGLTTRILQAAWMSIALAITMEVALLATAAAFDQAENLRPFIADLGGKISWSVIVCVGISMGLVVSGTTRGPVMGLLGLLAAPSAFALAKATHKSIAQGLDIMIAAPAGGPTAAQMMILRALEYGILGLAVGYISGRRAGLPLYAALGLATGASAAVVVLLITVRTAAAPPTALALISKGINEVLFPVGCSMVLFAANALGQRMRLAVAA